MLPYAFLWKDGLQPVVYKKNVSLPTTIDWVFAQGSLINNRINIEFFLLQFQSLFVSSFSCDPSSSASFSFLFLRLKSLINSMTSFDFDFDRLSYFFHVCHTHLLVRLRGINFLCPLFVLFFLSRRKHHRPGQNLSKIYL